MRADNQVIDKTNFGSVYLRYKRNLLGFKDPFIANVMDFSRSILEDSAKDCDIFISAGRKGNFKILVGEKTETPLKKLFPWINTVENERFSTADIHENYIVDTIIEHAQLAKKKFMSFRNYYKG